jgi:hypothetical protein
MASLKSGNFISNNVARIPGSEEREICGKGFVHGGRLEIIGMLNLDGEYKQRVTHSAFIQYGLRYRPENRLAWA